MRCYKSPGHVAALQIQMHHSSREPVPSELPGDPISVVQESISWAGRGAQHKFSFMKSRLQPLYGIEDTH